MIKKWSINHNESARSALKFCVTYLSFPRQNLHSESVSKQFQFLIETYLQITRRFFYLMIRTKLLTSRPTAVLFRELLSEGSDNKDNIKVRSKARGARENFDSLRTICDRT